MEIIVGIVTVIMLPLLVWLVWSRYQDNVELDAIQEEVFWTGEPAYMEHTGYKEYDPPMDEVYNISTVGDAPDHTEFDEETQTFTMSRRDDV